MWISISRRSLKGPTNQTIYGGVDWGFQIRSGAVVGSSEYAQAHGGASSTFDEALERFRGYYVHEPVVLYFDTDQELPVAGEETKLDDIPDYLARYPDVNVSIDGWADVRAAARRTISTWRSGVPTPSTICC